MIEQPTFWCEGCRHGGSALDYIHRLKVRHWDKPYGLDFIEAVRALAALSGKFLPEFERSTGRDQKGS